MTPRFGQLTYTSFDAGDGNPGGWQVKDLVGDLASNEVRFLTSRVGTQLDAGMTLPRFPTAEQIAALPHRLRYAAAAELGPGVTATWHTAPAGFDASGRPGNVFAHVVLDRGGDGAPVRPILSWRSPDWLTPYGVSQVLNAKLTSEQPPQPGTLDARAAAKLIFAPRTGHLALFQVLLDATLAASQGGPPVVLGVANLDDAASWIAAVQLCMSAGTAQRLWFSTLERADQLADARRLGIQLMAVPVTDLDALTRVKSLVVLDAEEPVALGDLGGSPHSTQRGDLVAVTEWSVMVAEVLEDADTFVRVTRAIDQTAADVGDIDLHPAWPLARMIAGGWDVDVLEEAQRVLELHSPTGFVDDSDLRERTGDKLRREVHRDTAAAWARASRATASSIDAEVYLELALADQAWLTEPGAARIPTATITEPGHRTVEATLRTSDKLTGSPNEPGPRTRAALYVLQLAIAAGAAWDTQVNSALVVLCKKVILPGLQDPDVAAEVLASMDYLITAPARGWLWSLLEHAKLPGPPGQRLPEDVVMWLAPRPELGETDPLPGTPFDESALTPSVAAQELALVLARNATASPNIGAWAVTAVLDHAAQQRTKPAVNLEPVIRHWPAEWLKALHRRYDGVVPVQWYTAALLDLDEPGLWSRLAHRSEGKLARSRLRTADLDWTLSANPTELMQNLGRLTSALTDANTAADQIRHDTGRGLAVAILSGQRPPEPWLSAVGEATVRPDSALLQWGAQLPEVTLLWWLMHGSAELALPTEGPWAPWLAGVTVLGGRDPLSLIETFLIHRWHTQRPGRSAHDQADQWRVEAEQSGARFDRHTDRWLRSWAQRRRTW